MARTENFVAIVDDEAALREAIESLLRGVGFDVKSFAAAEDFLRSRHRRRAGCLILDVGLPGMSGLDLQQYLSSIGVDTPIVFITAGLDDNGRLQKQALRAGAVAVLRKPFNDEDLLSAVRAALVARD